MIVSIMQPYFFPYMGYFQLLRASDLFIALDDVQYIDRGWVNRNRVWHGDAPAWLTFPVQRDQQTRAINERYYVDDGGLARQALRRKLASCYARAPRYSEVMALVDRVMQFPDCNVARFNIHLLRELSAFLGLRTHIEVASRMRSRPAKGVDGIIELCLATGATGYLNPIGGAHLYPGEPFEAAGLGLSFLRTDIESFPRFGVEGPGDLSIIDVLMFNSEDDVQRRLGLYQCLSGDDAQAGHAGL